MLINFGRIGENLMTSNWPRPLPDNKVFIPLPTPCAMCRRYKKKYKSQVRMCSTLESNNRAIRDEIRELQTQIKNRQNMISTPPFVIPCELS